MDLEFLVSSPNDKVGKFRGFEEAANIVGIRSYGERPPPYGQSFRCGLHTYSFRVVRILPTGSTDNGIRPLPPSADSEPSMMSSMMDTNRNVERGRLFIITKCSATTSTRSIVQLISWVDQRVSSKDRIPEFVDHVHFSELMLHHIM